jgi:hypothetical protein
MEIVDYNYLCEKRDNFMEAHGRDREVETFIAPSDSGSHHYPAFEVALINMISMSGETAPSELARETFDKLYVNTGLINVTPFPIDIYVMTRDTPASGFVSTGTGSHVSLREYCKKHGIPFEY